MYSYPIDYLYYEQEEIIVMAEFFAMIEDANVQKKVDKTALLKKYNEYRKIVGSISEEKSLDKEFEKLSGYSIFRTIKKYKDQ